MRQVVIVDSRGLKRNMKTVNDLHPDLKKVTLSVPATSAILGDEAFFGFSKHGGGRWKYHRKLNFQTESA
jgi:hypothetical protein